MGDLMNGASAERAREAPAVWLRRRSSLRAARLAALVTLALWLAYEGLAWALFGGRAASPAAEDLVRVEHGDLVETVVATGKMEPLSRVVVQSEIPGIVSAVRADAGDRVKRGQALVELDQSRLIDQGAELRAALTFEEARSRVDLVQRAEVELAKAHADHRRIEKLVRSRVASPEELERSAHLLRLAEIARSDSEAEHAARLAAVERARRALQRIERDIEKSIIRAPIDGVVLHMEAEVGTAVADLQNGGTVITTLADDSRIHLTGAVDENEIDAVRPGQSAEIHIDAFPGETFRGRVRKVSASGTAKDNVASFSVEVELEPDERVRVGMSADARIGVRDHRDVLLVPSTSVEQHGADTAVRLLSRDSEVIVRPVKVLYSDGFKTAIAAGVDEGDWILARAPGPDE
jgi:HlyD family secretion protein